MGSRRRKAGGSHKIYTVQQFATRKKMRQLRLRNGQRSPTQPKFWYEVLHCRNAQVPDALCYRNHVQDKVPAPKL